MSHMCVSTYDVFYATHDDFGIHEITAMIFHFYMNLFKDYWILRIPIQKRKE